MVNRNNGYNGRMNGMPKNASGCNRGCSVNNGQTRMNADHGDGSCGCSVDCKALMQRLQKIDFSIVDTVLYLNIYPDCSKALEYYNKLVEERAVLRDMLAKRCKHPMSIYENASCESWDWISSPWPWDASAN